jgi:hypothetical protein
MWVRSSGGRMSRKGVVVDIAEVEVVLDGGIIEVVVLDDGIIEVVVLIVSFVDIGV